MTKREEGRFTAEQKARAVVRHVQDGESISEICKELNIHPNTFYKWHKQALENLANAFVKEDKARKRKEERQIEQMQEEIQQKDSVIAELMLEHLRKKKGLG